MPSSPGKFTSILFSLCDFRCCYRSTLEGHSPLNYDPRGLHCRGVSIRYVALGRGYFNDGHKVSFTIEYSMYIFLHLYITSKGLESNPFLYPEIKESHALDFHFLVSLLNFEVYQ